MKRSISALTIILLTLVVIATGIVSFPVNASASWDNDYVSTALSKDRCLEAGRAVLQKAGFASVKITGSTVYGTRGSYTAFVRSIPDKQIAFIVVMGPDSKANSEFMAFIKTNGGW